MPIFRVASPRQGDSPVRVQSWQGTMRAGDDFKLAFTLVDDDGQTPLDVTGSRSRLSLFATDRRRGWTPDYGMGWETTSLTMSRPEVAIDGDVVDGPNGRINFRVTGSLTGQYFGRYNAFIEIDQPDGGWTELDGTVQVRPGVNTLGHINSVYMTPGIVAPGYGRIPARTLMGVPVDADLFPLTDVRPSVVNAAPDTGNSNILGIGVLGQMILGSGGAAGSSSSVLGIGVLGQMVLDVSGSSSSSVLGIGTLGQMVIDVSGTSSGSGSPGGPGGLLVLGAF